MLLFISYRHDYVAEKYKWLKTNCAFLESIETYASRKGRVSDKYLVRIMTMIYCYILVIPPIPIAHLVLFCNNITNHRNIKLSTKIKVYKAVVLTSLSTAVRRGRCTGTTSDSLSAFMQGH